MSSAPPPPDQGSLGIGFALAWACLIGGYIVSATVASAAFGPHPFGGDGLIVLLIGLPWLLMITLIVWLVMHGLPRTAIGVAIGMGSILGLALLLVAACFGMFKLNMH